MTKRRYFNRDQVEAIAQTLDEKAKKPVDRASLADGLEMSAKGFVIGRGQEGIKRPAEVRKYYREMLSKLEDLRQTYEHLREFAFVGVAVRYPDHMAPDFAGRMLTGPEGQSVMGSDEIQHMIERLRVHESWARAAIKRLGLSSSKGGRPRKAALPFLVHGLAQTYEGAIGMAHGTVGTSYDPYTGTRGGPFVRFVEQVLNHLEPGNNRRALGKTVQDILAKRGRPYPNE